MKKIVTQSLYTQLDTFKWGSDRTKPWYTEPDKVQYTDLETGMPCLIVRNRMGALCGYVGVSKNHPAYEKNYDSATLYDIEVHGGLTFDGKCYGKICHLVEDGEDDNVWWLGYDCSHLGDLTPQMFARFGNDDVYRDITYVEGQNANLAKQLAEMV